MKLTILLLIVATELFAQAIEYPGNPLEGRLVFEDKGCIECHSLSGYGGNIGPDLMKKQYYGSFSELAAIIWNHIPQMNRMLRKLHRERPFIKKKEMASLIGFIYYLPYLGQPGSLSKGKSLIKKKGCLNCHSINGAGGSDAPDFAKIQFNASPLFMVQTMWNHFPGMWKKFSETEREPAGLTGQEAADIAAYIQAVSPKTVKTRMTPGNPNNGKKIFVLKGCTNCHSVNGKDDSKAGPELKRLNLHSSVTEIGAAMWNHASQMKELMDEKKIVWPKFNGVEMADLIAYLYFLNFEEDAGDPGKGRIAFEENGCINCHGSDDDVGPNLTKGLKLKSTVDMITKMWNHSSKMEDRIISLNEDWPQLSAADIRNIYAFLRSELPQE